MKKFFLGLMAFVMVFSIIGCTKGVIEKENESNEEVHEIGIDNSELFLVNAYFKGITNNNKINLEIEDNLEAYDANEELIEKFATVKIDSKVQLEVKKYEDPSHNKIVSFEVVEEPKEISYNVIGTQFAGLADPHTAEFISLEFKNNFKSFQLSPKLQESLSKFKQGDLINLYFSGNEYEEIKKIEEIPFLNSKGRYIGLVDNHTVEMKFKNDLVSFQIDKDIKNKFEDIPDDAEILFNYRFDKNNFVISEILEWNLINTK